MNAIRNSSSLVMWVLLLMICISSGCKSKKKAAEASNAAAEKARVEQEATLRKQQEEEAKRKAEAEALAKREAESKEKAPYALLAQYFESISKSNNLTSANASINEVLTMFASPDTPVLIVISESNGQKDYDRPTTIISYLNYLKDQKKNMNKVSNLQFDSAGKITEVELRKN
jgi:hypothetical protein